MELAVRLGTVEDVDSLESLWIAMVEHHRQIVEGEWPVRAGAQAWSLRREQCLTWLREETAILHLAHSADGAGDGRHRPAGYVLCRLLESGPTFDLGARRGEIEDLVVARSVRGAGVGAALLEAARQELERRGIGFWSIGVLEANRAAIRLYERLGFRPWTRTMLAPVNQPG
jgi:ribosomal protein S18 acetylase RimI-like enzyme